MNNDNILFYPWSAIYRPVVVVVVVAAAAAAAAVTLIVTVTEALAVFEGL